MHIAQVVLDTGLDKPLDYTIPADMSLEIGSRVLVPLRKQLVRATVVEFKSDSRFKTQPIARLLTTDSLVSPKLFTLATWISTYYATPLRRVLKLFLPSAVRKETKPKTQLFIKRAHPQAKTAALATTLRTKAPQQAKVLDTLLQAPKGLLLSQLLETAAVSRAPVDALIEKKAIQAEEMHIDRSALEGYEFFQTKPKKLLAAQGKALSRIIESINKNSYATHLLYGITGSGKTEIYLQAIAHARSQGKGVIMLVPEISLTAQTIERFRSRFSEHIAILHHRLSDGERYDAFEAMRKGESCIVIGARSAIFSPIKNLGLIIVDEEHDHSYKQSDSPPCYHGRDVAIMRAHMEGATAILGSATPALETYTNALSGKYTLSHLDVRATGANRPTIHTVDMRTEYERADGFTLFSDKLITAIKVRLELGEQVLLFLNKRGYHSFQLCTGCGQSISCPHCSVTLTFHRGSNHLVCHLCHYTLAPPPKECPSCKSPATLTFKGYGTEQVERAIHAIIPSVRTLRMDADTTRHKGAHEKLFKQFRSGKADVLIGTQMVAKGLHFPSVTLVGVLASDHALNIPDFRASETVFQLLTQVAGRSGRGQLPGDVIIQTTMTNNPVIRLAAQEDYEGFYEQELAVRKAFAYPPYAHFAKLTISGPDEQKTLAFANAIHAHLLPKLPSTYTLYPIVPSGHAKIKDRYRFKLLIKGPSIMRLSPLLQSLPIGPSGTRVLIDIDPMNLFF